MSTGAKDLQTKELQKDFFPSRTSRPKSDVSSRHEVFTRCYFECVCLQSESTIMIMIIAHFTKQLCWRKIVESLVEPELQAIWIKA